MEELDQYLSGKMSDKERRRFEDRLHQEPNLQAELYVRQGLSQLRLQKKVADAAAARKKMTQDRFRRRLLIGFLVSGAVILLLFVVLRDRPVKPSSHISPTGQQQPGGQNLPDSDTLQREEKTQSLPEIPDKSKKTPSRQPIAQTSPEELPPPLYPGPNVRGSNSDNKAWKAMLDQLWYTDYPAAGFAIPATFSETDQLLKARDFNKAYVRLQRLERTLPENDTLRYLKGYCLMEMGEGAEALTYFENLEKTLPGLEPQLQWYRGLCLLLTGDREKAAIEFKKIAALARHPYSLQSKRAVALMR